MDHTSRFYNLAEYINLSKVFNRTSKEGKKQSWRIIASLLNTFMTLKYSAQHDAKWINLIPSKLQRRWIPKSSQSIQRDGEWEDLYLINEFSVIIEYFRDSKVFSAIAKAIDFR